MHITLQKEQYSKAYIHAVAATAGLKIKPCDVDDDSIDLDIAADRSFQTGKPVSAPHLGVQAKCTENDDGLGNDFAYELPIKNYDDLRDPQVHIPRILVVVCVPESDWLHETPEHMAMRRTLGDRPKPAKGDRLKTGQRA